MSESKGGRSLFAWIITAAVTIGLIAGIELGLAGIDAPARRALIIFVLAVVGWTTRINDTFVGLSAAVAMALFVAGTPEDLFEALGDNLIWLLIAAFIFAAAFRESGLAGLLVQRIASGAPSVRRMFHALAVVMIGSAFVIPSTSARSAMMLPIFAAITADVQSRIRVAFALLIPTVVLLSAFASLIGAGAHIAAVEFLVQMKDISVSFAYWTLLCLPFALVSTFIGVELILLMFLTREQRRTHLSPVKLDEPQTTVLGQPFVWVMGAVLLGWLTTSWHGVNETLIAIIGALVLTMPRYGTIGLKEAIKQVNWNLLIFLAATISLAQTMVRADIGGQLLHGPFGDINNVDLSPLQVVIAVAAIGSVLHLIVHSRTARVAVLLPPVLLLADETGMNPIALMLVTVAATGLCQTLMVSAKSVIMYGQIDEPTYSQVDLLRLSAVLAPIHFVLIILFALVVWPWLGVPLVEGN